MSSIIIQCDVADAVVIRGTLTDEAGDAVTGADVTARAFAPGDAEETDLGAASEEASTGVYAITLEPDASGSWLIRMESAAPHKAAAECVVFVRESRFA